jgi:hypothetical protein
MSNKRKPQVQLVGQDGNVFNLMGICVRALKRVDQHDEAKELQKRVMSCNSYDEALVIMLDYIDETGDDDDGDDGDD